MKKWDPMNTFLKTVLWTSAGTFFLSCLLTLTSLVWNAVSDSEFIEDKYLSQLFTTIIIAIGTAGATAFANALTTQIRNSKSNLIQVAAMDSKQIDSREKGSTKEITIYGTYYSSRLDTHLTGQVFSGKGLIISAGQMNIIKDGPNRWKAVFYRDVSKESSETLNLELELTTANGKRLAIDNYSFVA